MLNPIWITMNHHEPYIPIINHMVHFHIPAISHSDVSSFLDAPSFYCPFQTSPLAASPWQPPWRTPARRPSDRRGWPSRCRRQGRSGRVAPFFIPRKSGDFGLEFQEPKSPFQEAHFLGSRVFQEPNMGWLPRFVDLTWFLGFWWGRQQIHTSSPCRAESQANRRVQELEQENKRGCWWCPRPKIWYGWKKGVQLEVFLPRYNLRYSPYRCYFLFMDFMGNLERWCSWWDVENSLWIDFPWYHSWSRTGVAKGEPVTSKQWSIRTLSVFSWHFNAFLWF